MRHIFSRPVNAAGITDFGCTIIAVLVHDYALQRSR